MLRHWAFYHVLCSSSGACSFPSCRLPWGFQVTGCLSFCFPGDVGWASALPFFFCASPAPTGLQGLAGFCTLCQGAPVAVVSAIGLKVRSPCCPSHTLGWVCFWPTVSQAFVGCEGGLGCPSWFVLLFMCVFVLHLFWGWGGLVTGLWPLLCNSWVLDSSDARLCRPDALASGRTLSFCRRGFFLGRLFGLGLVGCVRA